MMALVFIFLLLNKFYIFSFIDLSHEIQKGNYEYLCTYPGHAEIMRGYFFVK